VKGSRTDEFSNVDDDTAGSEPPGRSFRDGGIVDRPLIDEPAFIEARRVCQPSRVGKPLLIEPGFDNTRDERVVAHITRRRRGRDRKDDALSSALGGKVVGKLNDRPVGTINITGGKKSGTRFGGIGNGPDLTRQHCQRPSGRVHESVERRDGQVVPAPFCASNRRLRRSGEFCKRTLGKRSPAPASLK
jgi:hypothetical protein